MLLHHGVPKPAGHLGLLKPELTGEGDLMLGLVDRARIAPQRGSHREGTGRAAEEFVDDPVDGDGNRFGTGRRRGRFGPAAKNQAQADIGPIIVGRGLPARGAPAAPGRRQKASPAQDAHRPFGRSGRVGGRVARQGAVPVAAPFRDVAESVVQFPGVRGLGRDRVERLSAVDLVPGDRGDTLGSPPRTESAGAAGVFPLGLGRKVKDQPLGGVVPLIENVDKFPGVVPAGVNRIGRVVVGVGEFFHHTLPLPLGHLGLEDPKRLGDRHLVKRFIAAAQRFLGGAPHLEGSRRTADEQPRDLLHGDGDVLRRRRFFRLGRLLAGA